MDDPVKAKTRQLGGIPPLVALLNNEIPEIHRNACGALRSQVLEKLEEIYAQQRVNCKSNGRTDQVIGRGRLPPSYCTVVLLQTRRTCGQMDVVIDRTDLLQKIQFSDLT